MPTIWVRTPNNRSMIKEHAISVIGMSGHGRNVNLEVVADGKTEIVATAPLPSGVVLTPESVEEVGEPIRDGFLKALYNLRNSDDDYLYGVLSYENDVWITSTIAR